MRPRCRARCSRSATLRAPSGTGATSGSTGSTGAAPTSSARGSSASPGATRRRGFDRRSAPTGGSRTSSSSRSRAATRRRRTRGPGSVAVSRVSTSSIGMRGRRRRGATSSRSTRRPGCWSRSGRGTSFRWSSRTTRRDANRLSRTLFGRLIPSAHGQLAQDYLATFAPIALDTCAPPAQWPDAIVLDSKPISFTLTTRHPNGTTTSQPAAYHLLGIHGYPAGRGSGRPWRIFVAGGADGVEWEKVLWSLPGTPSWVVCDENKGIKSRWATCGRTP